MIKERGGKAQVAFRNALGLCESEDLQFQQIKVSDQLPLTPRVAVTFLTAPHTSPGYQALRNRSQTKGTGEALQRPLLG